MKMKTRQSGSVISPESAEDTLALIIRCQKCDTQRAFRVNDGFAAVVIRKSSGVEYVTWCEKCGQRISVQLCWTKRHKHWLSERIILKDAVSVEDEFGLGQTEGVKRI
jgi:hypothetical protein